MFLQRFAEKKGMHIMKRWEDDEKLFGLIKRELFTAVVGDIMDELGLHTQFLPPTIKPLIKGMSLVGRAMPVLEADVFAETYEGSANELMSKPFGLMLQALDSLKAGEIYICTGSSPRYALWGELMSIRAMHLKAAGAVLDGYARDTRGIERLNFPTFAYGSYAQDQGPRGKVIDFHVPIEIEGVKIKPGDIIIGDVDGVCVVPRQVEEEVFRVALEKVRTENLVRLALEEGSSAIEAFTRYQVM
jgi:regulator of RNase E activity RraA